MTLRNVPNSYTLEQQRQEINLMAVDLDTAVDGIQTFTGAKTFDDTVTFSTDVTFEAQSFWGDGDQAIFGDDSDLKIYTNGTDSYIDSNTGILHIEGATDFDSNVTLIDGVALKCAFNSNIDFEIFHNGANAYLYNRTGDLYLQNDTNSNSIFIQASGGTGGISVNALGSVDLYYDQYKKFETTATGVSITGNIDTVTDISCNSIVNNAGGGATWSLYNTGSADFTGTVTASNFSGPVTGNADTATALATARNIAGQSFDGTADITIAATDLSDTDQALATTSDVTFNSVDAGSFTVNGSPLQTDVATTTSVGTVQPDGTTIGIDANGVISVTGGGDPFTANGFKFGVNEATGPAATLGEFRQISGKPYFYDGSAWQEFILGSTQQVTIPAETAWDKVIVRATFDSDFNDVKFGDTGTPNTYTIYNSINFSPSTIVGTPAKFGTGVLKNVGNGVVYSHRSEYNFESEFTIECWVYFDSAPASYTQEFQEKHVVFSKANTSMTAGSWQVYVKKAANGNHFWYIDIHDTATDTETRYQLDSIGSSWSTSGYDKQWVHIALVKESDGTLHFYKDGVDGLYTYAGGVSGNNITNTTFDLAIGVPQEAGQVQNDMFIDDLRITTDARYTSSGVYQQQDFTPPTTAHPISGTTTTFTPPPTSKAGEIVLGPTPTWTGTAGVTVSQTVSGTYRMTFTNPFANATDYYVITNHMDYPGGQAVFVHLTRAAGHIDFIIYRDGDGNPVDQGSLAVQVIAH